MVNIDKLIKKALPYMRALAPQATYIFDGNEKPVSVLPGNPVRKTVERGGIKIEVIQREFTFPDSSPDLEGIINFQGESWVIQEIHGNQIKKAITEAL